MNSSISHSQIEDFIDTSQFPEIKPKEILAKIPKSSLNYQANQNFSLLQTQYDEAMTYVKQMDGIRDQYNKVSKENSQLKIQNDEFERRLNISLQINDELKAKLANKNETEKENSNLQLIIENESKKHENEISKLNEINSNAEQKIKIKEKQIQNLKEELSQIYNALSKKFDNKIDTTDKVIEFLTKDYIEIQTQVEILPVLENDDQIYKKKFMKLKKKNDNLKKSFFHLTSQFQSKENETKIFNETVDDLQQSIQKIQKDTTEKIADKQLIIDKLEIDLNNERKKTEVMKSNIHKINEQKQLDLIKQQKKYEKNELDMKLQYENSINETKMNFESIKNKEINQLQMNFKKKFIVLIKNIEHLKIENASLKDQIQQLTKKCHESNSDNQLLADQLMKIKSEKEELELFKQMNSSSMKADKVELDKREQKLYELSSEIDQFETERSIYQSLLEKQKDEIQAIYSERMKFLTLFKQLSLSIKFCEKFINDMLYENSLLVSQNESLRNESNVTATEVKMIPLTVWTSINVSTDLVKEIVEIGGSDKYQLPEKIIKVISKITQYYQNELETKDETLKTMVEEMNDANDNHNQFIETLCNIVFKSNSNQTIDKQEIFSNIRKIYQENSNLLTEITRYDNFIQTLYTKLNVTSFPEALNTIDGLLKRIEKLESKCVHQKNIHKKLIKKLRHMQNQSSIKQNQLEELIKEQQSVTTSFSIEKDNIQKENDQIQFKYQSLQNQYESLENSSQEAIKRLKAESKLSQKQMIAQFENEKQSLQKLINDQSLEIKKLTETNSNQDAQLKNYQNDILELKSNLDSQQIQLKQMKTSFFEQQTQFQGQLKIDQEKYTKNLNTLHQTYKNKIAALQKVLDEATFALNQSDSRNKELIYRSNKIQNENKKLITQIKYYEVEFEKERKFHESKLKALQMTIDLEHSINHSNS